jgi:transcriptional regulator with XRE-family HTH domain
MATVQLDGLNRTISTNIGLALAAAGMSQRKLSKELGISASRVNDYVQGRVRPGDDRLAKIAEKTGRTVGWFYDPHQTA